MKHRKRWNHNNSSCEVSKTQTTLNKQDKNKTGNRGENMSASVCIYLMRSAISLIAKPLQIPEI